MSVSVAAQEPVQATAMVELTSARIVDDTPTFYQDVMEWYYKKVNGVLYKRLYNATKDEWVGDWIPY